MKNSKSEIIFVYNAKGDIFSSVADTIHKIVSPKTYQCNLCAITYGIATMKTDWKTFIDNLPIEVEFLHKDEFQNKYPNEKIQFPVALIKNQNKIKTLISSVEINKCNSIDDLKKLVNEKIRNIK